VRRVIPIVLVLTVLMPSVAMAAAWYRCRDGAVRASCCCPSVQSAKTKPRALDETATIRRTPCCEIDRIAAPETATARAPEPAFTAPAPLLIPSTASFDAVAFVARVADVPVARVPTGPPEPIFVRNCALLL
jgi:hypothetical protein